MGKYHSYSTPNYYIRNYNLLSSSQIALDYYYEKDKFNISSAIYYKTDKGDISTNNFEKYEKYVSDMREEYDKINSKDEMVN